MNRPAMRTRVAVLGVVALGIGGPIGAALAYWSATSVTNAGARAGRLAAGNQPVPVRHGHTVVLTWEPSALVDDGRPATGYEVRRLEDPTGATVTCMATTVVTVCAEDDVPVGSWTYIVTPRFAAWRGLASESSAPVTIDPPSLTLPPGQVVNATQHTLSSIGLTSLRAGEVVELQIEPAAAPGAGIALVTSVTADDDGNVAPFTVTVPTVDDGIYRIRAVGDRTSVATSGTFLVDTTPPVSHADAPTGWVRAAVNVHVEATDAPPGSVASISYRIGGAVLVVAPGDRVDVAVNASSELTWYATDTAGNVEPMHTATVRVDPLSPTIGPLVVPAVVRNGAALSTTAADEAGGSGLESVTFLYCTGASCVPATTIGAPDTAAPYGLLWTDQPADGTYRVAARAADVAGNTTMSATVAVVVDNSAPAATMNPLSILSTPVVGRVVPMTATVVDTGSGVQSVRFEYSATGGPWTPIATVTTGLLNVFGTTWDASTLDPGQYAVRVVAADVAGNTATSTAQSATLYGATAVQLVNGGGAAGVGRIEQGDSIRVTFNVLPSRTAMCPGAWNARFDPLAGQISVTVIDGGGAAPDRISVSAANCVGGGQWGTIVLGSSEHVGAGGAAFGKPGATTSSRITFDTATLTLTITLGELTSGATVAVVTPTVATYTPSPLAVANTGAVPAGAARTAPPGGIVNF